MNASRRIAVASLGDPRDGRTWSGTPKRIIRALEDQGIDVSGVDTNIESPWRRAAYFAEYHLSRQSFGQVNNAAKIRDQVGILTSGARSDFNYSRHARTHRAQRLRQALASMDVDHVLHMTTLSLAPGEKPDSSVKNFLFCDTTWNITANNQPLYRYSSSLRREIEALEAAAFEQVDHFFPTAEYVRADLIEHYRIDPGRVTAVGTGRGDLIPFRGQKDPAQGHILFTAKLRFEEKGGPLLIDAFKLARERNKDLKLVIVGQDSYRERLGDIPGVTILGHVSKEELQSLFDNAALYAMPALCEPWGLVYLEALASRTPLLGLNRNSLPEITQNGKFGFLVNEPSPQAVAAEMLRAFADPERMRKMGESGQKHCLETYTWECVASRICSAMFAPQAVTLAN